MTFIGQMCSKLQTNVSTIFLMVTLEINMWHLKLLQKSLLLRLITFFFVHSKYNNFYSAIPVTAGYPDIQRMILLVL